MPSRLSVKESLILAQLIHAHHRSYREDIPFWQTLAARQGGPVLELGCGAGRVLLVLAESGQAVYGLDKDPDVLNILAQRLAESKLSNVEYRQADMTDFQFEVEFPLIILPCNTYSVLTSQQRQAMLGRVHTHLAPGGIFAVSMLNPARIANLPDIGESELEETFPHPQSGGPVQVSSAWRRGEDSLEVSWHYDHLLPDGKVERATATINHHISSVDEYQQELKQAGYDLKHVYGDFNREPYQPDSPYYIFSAHQRS